VEVEAWRSLKEYPNHDAVEDADGRDVDPCPERALAHSFQSARGVDEDLHPHDLSIAKPI
jgi:hypothetical protein